MKRTLVLVLALRFLACASTAQNIPKAPPELTTLKAHYQSDVETKRKPIRARYITELETLKKSLTSGPKPNLDEVVAVDQELAATKGEAAKVSGGKVTAELTKIKSTYEAAVQAACKDIRAKYITDLGVLQDTFTKKDKLPDAQAVKRELSSVNPSGNAGAPVPLPDSPGSNGLAADLVQTNSIWFGEPHYTLTITERNGESFKATFEVGPNILREVKGTIKNGKLFWLGKDAVGIKGNQGGDNYGTIKGEKIDFEYRDGSGHVLNSWTMKLKKSS